MTTEMIEVTSFDYAHEAARVREVLRQEFPRAAFSTSEGWRGRVHVKIVSEEFDGKRDTEKGQIVRDALDHHLGPDADAVSLVMAYGLDEI